MQAAAVLCFSLASIALNTAQSDRARITAASNVRLRTQPSVEVSIVTTVPLGTEVVEVGATTDGSWIRVRTIDGQGGWLLAELTRALPSGRRLPVAERIVQERLLRSGDGRRARIELVSFVERMVGEVVEPAAAARFAFYRLRAVKHVLDSLRFRGAGRDDGPREFLETYAPLIVDNEIGGGPILRYEAILEVQDRHRGTRTADEIAWLAVTNGLRGECEGDLPCHAEWSNLLEGEYLRRHPQGIFAGQAVQRLFLRALWWREAMANPRVFNPVGECAPFMKPVAAIRMAVEGARAGDRDRTLRELDEISRACR